MRILFLFRHWALLGLCIAITASSCDKSDEAPCDCQEVELVPNSFGTYPSRGLRVFYSRPIFNPTNPREVAYLKTDQQDKTVTGLWKMNLDTRNDLLPQHQRRNRLHHWLKE